LILAFALVLSLVHTASVSPIPLDISKWLHGQILPSRGKTLAGEIKCYNLPYGGMSFLSHILTYYTVTMLLLSKTPLFPRPGEEIEHGIRDCFLSALGMIGSVTISILNISACRSRWQFMCIGIWKLTLSFILCVTGLHQFAKFMEHGWIDDTHASSWLGAYVVGTIVGMVGLLSLVYQLFHEKKSIRIITGIFASISFLPLLMWISVALVWALIQLWCYARYFIYIDDVIGSYKWKLWGDEINSLSLAFYFAIATALF
jgi:hypothetical protein